MGRDLIHRYPDHMFRESQYFACLLRKENATVIRAEYPVLLCIPDTLSSERAQPPAYLYQTFDTGPYLLYHIVGTDGNSGVREPFSVK